VNFPQLFAAAAPIDRPRFGVAVICAASVSIQALGSRGDLLLHLMVIKTVVFNNNLHRMGLG